MLLNLLGNAVKFTEEGEVLLRVSRPDAEHDNQRDRVRIEVTDTGIGIDPENLAKVFDSFSQEDGSVTRRFGGTGLGLAISKQLVELMGGDIAVHSSRGSGTTFWFEISLELQSNADRESEPDLEGIRLLVVDDNPTNREILMTQLESWGVDVRTADSGRTAVDTIANGFTPDVVLLDLHMPGMSGLDTARELMQVRDGTPAKIVLLSSLSRQLTNTERKELNIASTLTKPVRQKLLKSCIAGLVDRPTDACISEPAQAHSEHDNAQALLNAEVLLVEDNLVNQEVAKAMLKMLGCKTTTATNGKQAIELLIGQDQRFDIVLMDCQMPEMDGFTATRALRDHERASGRPAQPVVALTANALTGDRERCLDAGMNDYLSKPFTMPDLRTIIAKQLVAENDDDADQTADDAA